MQSRGSRGWVGIFFGVALGIVSVYIIKISVRGKARAGILGMLARVQNH